MARSECDRRPMHAATPCGQRDAARCVPCLADPRRPRHMCSRVAVCGISRVSHREASTRVTGRRDCARSSAAGDHTRSALPGRPPRPPARATAAGTAALRPMRPHHGAVRVHGWPCPSHLIPLDSPPLRSRAAVRPPPSAVRLRPSPPSASVRPPHAAPRTTRRLPAVRRRTRSW